MQTPSVSTTAAQKLPVVRDRLTNYVKELHKPFSKLDLSPYKVIGRYDAVVNAPRVKYSGPIDNVTQEQLDQTFRELSELAEISKLVGDPRYHPWRDTSRRYYSEGDFENIINLCEKLLVQLENINLPSVKLAEQLGLPQLHSRSGLQDFAAVSEIMGRSPGAPRNVLESNLWNVAPPNEVVDLLLLGRDVQKRVHAMNSLFRNSVYEVEHAEDVKYVEAKLTGLIGLVALLDSRYRQIRKRWIKYRLPSYRGSMRVEAEYLKRVDQINTQ